MSFAFKTTLAQAAIMSRMNSPTPPRCPFHAPAATTTSTNQASAKWPPGPRAGLTGWRLLRRMSHNLLDALTAWKQEFGAVVHLRLWPEHQIVITDPELVRELLITHHEALVRWERGINIFAQLHGHSVLIAEGQAWQDKRRALQPGFARKPVQAFVPAIAAAARQSFARWPQAQQHWPIERELTALAMDVIVRMVFSGELGADTRSAEHAMHLLSMAANGEFYWPVSWPNWVPWKRTKRQALATLQTLINQQVQTRLQLPQAAWPDDLLSNLLQLHLQDTEAWPLQAVHDECMTIFLAGHETVAATLSWWSWCMAANPDAQTKAREEVRLVLSGHSPTVESLSNLPYLTQTLQETLRLYPAAPVLISRRTTKAISLGPWQLPERTMVMVPVQLMHHDPAYFPEPLAFRPERFERDANAAPRGAYLPFGAGPRVCLGQNLAMMEMTVIAAMLLQRFELQVPQGMAAPEPVLNVTLRPRQSLCLQLAAHG